MWSLTILGILLLVAVWYVRGPRSASPRLSTREVIDEMQSRAELAITDAERKFDVKLDFSTDSVETLESILAEVHHAHTTEPLSNEELTRHALNWGGYLGEVIKRVRAAEWKLDSDAGGNGSFPLVYDDGSESFPVRWCLKRIVNGEEDNVLAKFNILVIHRDDDFDIGNSFVPAGAN